MLEQALVDEARKGDEGAEDHPDPFAPAPADLEMRLDQHPEIEQEREAVDWPHDGDDLRHAEAVLERHGNEDENGQGRGLEDGGKAHAAKLPVVVVERGGHLLSFDALSMAAMR